jgi:hypothetical protein
MIVNVCDYLFWLACNCSGFYSYSKKSANLDSKLYNNSIFLMDYYLEIKSNDIITACLISKKAISATSYILVFLSLGESNNK